MSDGKEIFELEDPQNWVYQIRLYIISHSQLQIGMTNRKTRTHFYLNFIGVEFFDCLCDWSGRGFTLGSREECLDILWKMDAFRDYPKSRLDVQKLYIAEPENGHRIRILASGVTLTKANLFANFVPDYPYSTPENNIGRQNNGLQNSDGT